VLAARAKKDKDRGTSLLVVKNIKKDKGALFLVVAISLIGCALWVPGTAALFAKAVTTSQNWRIFFLMPMGYFWGWLFVRAWRLSQRVVPERPLAMLHPAMSVIPLLVVVLLFPDIWEHTGRIYPDTTFGADDWVFFHEAEAVVNDAAIGASPETSKYVTVFWTDVTIYFRVRANPEKDNIDLESFFNEPGTIDPAQIVQRYNLDYLLYDKAEPISGFIAEQWACCERVRESPSYALDKIALQDEIGDIR
jgi:hypothetical protein